MHTESAGASDGYSLGDCGPFVWDSDGSRRRWSSAIGDVVRLRHNRRSLVFSNARLGEWCQKVALKRV